MQWHRLIFILPALAIPASAKGVYIRFLASPSEDSIVHYNVYRSESPDGPGISLGGLESIPGLDTLGFPDSGSLVKGRPYFYSIRAVNAAGLESDPSAPTGIAYPSLSLPDTLRPDGATRLTRVSMAPTADPLKGTAPLSLYLVDSTRFQVTYDTAAHMAWFRSRGGKADTARLILGAAYFGKFEDRDTVLVMVAAAEVAGVESHAEGPGTAFSVPARFSPSTQGPMALPALPGPGALQIFSPSGAKVFEKTWAVPQARLLWNGRGRDGRPLKPARYILVVRGPGDRIHGRGAFFLSP